ncbi:transcriptional regulator [Streptomyces fractus]|uniref:transcriptional regulator n=1 Tax=Streptomyces fractus TaxID=641806 RepID=UPI003CF922F7
MSTDARAGVSPMLSRLAGERATGALIREHGTLYLEDGRVVHAESPATPGMDVLLMTGGAVQAEGWSEAVDRAGSRQRVGRYLVERGRLSDGALELCHLGALFDASYFTLAPSGGPSRFRYGVSHWFGAVRPVPVASVERESLRRRELLQRIWPEPDTDTAPLSRVLRHGETAVPPRRRRVLDLVDGVRTASQIALALGRPAFHTLVDLRRLAACGLVTTAPAPAPPEWLELAVVEEPDVALLRRLRAGLEAL